MLSGALQVNESLITGEADPIDKRENDELRSGSIVISGKARARLTQVGADAYAARLAMEAKADPRAEKSEMMRSLDKLIRMVGVLLIPVGILLFYQEYQVLQRGLQDSAESTVAALVGMIPEGLYLLTSVAVAASALKLAKKNVLVQDMNCIETLARVDVLCVDKTGTITEPVMQVEHILPLTEEPPERLEEILSAMYGGEEPENDTARAVAELFPDPPDWVCVKRIPFTSATKWCAAVFEGQGSFVVGAPERVTDGRFPEITEQAESWSARGYRVLLACEYSGSFETALESHKLHPLALIMMTNRIREEAPDTFAYFAQQGVSIRVISGDHPLTVSEVASRAGIPGAEHWVDAQTLQTQEDYLRAAEHSVVFGRVTPDQKKKLVHALQALGHTVAMTGDGVNDVLAMKESNCGIAMASGAQAASQVAQLVLLESDFSAMPAIVAEGRRVINNIQRAATLFLVKNIFSLGLALISLLSGWPYPLIPIHLTMISALTIGIPSFFLAMEPNYQRFSGRFLRSVLSRALPGGLTNIIVVVTAQAFMMVFGMAVEQISAVSTAILGLVGLLVLFQVSKPFDLFRRIIWWAMAVALVLCFTLLGGFLELYPGDAQTLLLMGTLLAATPVVFFGVLRIFHWGEALCKFVIHRKRSREK